MSFKSNVPPAPFPAPSIGRFAPSPTGPLHAGSLQAALGSWLFARRAGGAWRVRVEDIDPPREVPGAAAAQLEALQACGLVPDGDVLHQSSRGHAYAAALDRLLQAGLAFECHCSRADVAAHGGLHRACVPGRRRPDPAVRLRVPDGASVAFDDAVCGPQVEDVSRTAGDVVLRRADGLWAYQLAVVVDDAFQGVTEVVRGRDLLDSTGRQILLQRALGVPTPDYAHLPVVLDATGRKLSKSDAAHPFDDSRPLAALSQAWAGLGQAPDALADARDVHDWLARAVVAFDLQRLRAAAMHNGIDTCAP